MRETLTDLLDAAAILLMAAGLGCQATGWVTVLTRGSYGFSVAMVGIGLCVAALTVFAGSWWAARSAEVER